MGYNEVTMIAGLQIVILIDAFGVSVPEGVFVLGASDQRRGPLAPINIAGSPKTL